MRWITLPSDPTYYLCLPYSGDIVEWGYGIGEWEVSCPERILVYVLLLARDRVGFLGEGSGEYLPWAILCTLRDILCAGLGSDSVWGDTVEAIIDCRRGGEDIGKEIVKLQCVVEVIRDHFLGPLEEFLLVPSVHKEKIAVVVEAVKPLIDCLLEDIDVGFEDRYSQYFESARWDLNTLTFLFSLHSTLFKDPTLESITLAYIDEVLGQGAYSTLSGHSPTPPSPNTLPPALHTLLSPHSPHPAPIPIKEYYKGKMSEEIKEGYWVVKMIGRVGRDTGDRGQIASTPVEGKPYPAHTVTLPAEYSYLSVHQSLTFSPDNNLRAVRGGQIRDKCMYLEAEKNKVMGINDIMYLCVPLQYSRAGSEDNGRPPVPLFYCLSQEATRELLAAQFPELPRPPLYLSAGIHRNIAYSYHLHHHNSTPVHTLMLYSTDKANMVKDTLQPNGYKVVGKIVGNTPLNLLTVINKRSSRRSYLVAVHKPRIYNKLTYDIIPLPFDSRRKTPLKPNHLNLKNIPPSSPLRLKSSMPYSMMANSTQISVVTAVNRQAFNCIVVSIAIVSVVN